MAYAADGDEERDVILREECRSFPEVAEPRRPRVWRRLRARRLLRLGLLGFALLPATGCLGGMEDSQGVEVRLIDASAGARGMDVYFGPRAMAYNLGLGTVTSYMPLGPGSQTITSDLAGSRTVLASVNGSFVAEGRYTVLAGDADAGYAETVVRDQAQPAPPGQVSLRVLDQARRAGEVDLYLLPAGSSLGSVPAALTGVNFGRNTGYINLPAGTYSLVALPAGTLLTASDATSYTGTAIAYGSGSAHTLVLLDQPLASAAGSMQVIVATDVDANAPAD